MLIESKPTYEEKMRVPPLDLLMTASYQDLIGSPPIN